MSKLINEIRQAMYVEGNVNALSTLLRESYQLVLGGGIQFHFFPSCVCMCVFRIYYYIRACYRMLWQLLGSTLFL